VDTLLCLTMSILLNQSARRFGMSRIRISLSSMDPSRNIVRLSFPSSSDEEKSKKRCFLYYFFVVENVIRIYCIFWFKKAAFLFVCIQTQCNYDGLLLRLVKKDIRLGIQN